MTEQKGMAKCAYCGSDNTRIVNLGWESCSDGESVFTFTVRCADCKMKDMPTITESALRFVLMHC